MYTVKDIRFETRDDYGRKTAAEKVLKLIEQGEGNSPLFIDGAWGAGKSEFCYKLFHFLKESNEGKEGDDSSKLMVSYINSFAGDYQSNPFMLIVQAIYNSLITKDASVEDIERVQGILSKGISFAKRFFVAGFRSANFKIAPPLSECEIEINAGNFIDNVKEGIKQENKEFEEAFFEELESFRQQSEQLIGFKSAISEALDGKKLVLIIDELDRCRPDYALELLENVKHIFEIENLFIIFSTNKKQLEAMIHKRYGYGMDAEGYLEKFYQETIFLTSKVSDKSIDEEHHFKGHLTVFCEKLERSTRNRPGRWGELDFRVLPFVKELLGTVEARQVEKVADKLNLYCHLADKTLDSGSDSWRSIVVLGAFLSVVKPEILRNIKKATARTELLNYVRELPVNSDELSKLETYLTNDLEGVTASRDDFFSGKSPCIIKEVGEMVL